MRNYYVEATSSVSGTVDSRFDEDSSSLRTSIARRDEDSSSRRTSCRSYSATSERRANQNQIFAHKERQ